MTATGRPGREESSTQQHDGQSRDRKQREEGIFPRTKKKGYCKNIAGIETHYIYLIKLDSIRKPKTGANK